MIRADQIPPEVVKDAMLSWAGSEGAVWAAMREAIAAALSAWPGAKYTGPSGGGISQEPLQAPLIILPLRTENTND